MIRQHKPKELSSSSNIGEGFILLTFSKLAKFKDLLETIEINDMINIESRYKQELALVYANLIKDIILDILSKENKGDQVEEDHQNIIKALRLQGSMAEKVALCMDDLFDMGDINVANELSLERMKTQC